MLSMNDLKIGTVISINQEPYTVQYTQHVQMGRGSAVLRTKLKSLVSGNVLEKTFKSGDKMEEAGLSRSKANFLYRENDNFFFMDNASFEQFSLSLEQIGEISKYVKDGSDVDIMNFGDKPITVNLPPKVELKVVSAPPGTRGNTAQGGVTKPVTLETGYTVNVPLFIKEGDILRINTQSGEYVERANK